MKGIEQIHFKPFPIRALALEFPKCENHSIGFYSRCSKNKSPNVEKKHGKHLLDLSLFANRQILNKPSLLFQDFDLRRPLMAYWPFFPIKAEQRYARNTLYDKSFFVHRNFSCTLINEKKSCLPMSPAVIALFFTLAGIWYLGCKKILKC